jgi:hypothetical protein
MSQRSNSSVRKKKLNLLTPFEFSSAYEKDRDNYDQTLKYQHLKDKCAKLQSELTLSQTQLREERKKSH